RDLLHSRLSARKSTNRGSRAEDVESSSNSLLRRSSGPINEDGRDTNFPFFRQVTPPEEAVVVKYAGKVHAQDVLL
ncbi:unnamed protein product, partial [Amoebophrya sp. A25]